MDKYQGMVFAEALRFTGNREEAEDLSQEIFLKAFEKLSTFKGRSKFPTWLYKIGKNLALSKQRSKQIILNPSTAIENEISQNHTPEELILESEHQISIRNLLNKLPHTYKNPLHLYYFENMSYAEISQTLNMKMNTLKSTILRGKEILKKWIQDHEK
jgi:RNA polymerase sigma-70 factor, ECF subfamily